MKPDSFKPNLVREADPERQPHEYFRDGMAKLLTLFHLATGKVRVKGLTSSTNAILHLWLKEELSAILQPLLLPKALDAEINRKLWEMWQAGLSLPITLPENIPSSHALDLGQLAWSLYNGFVSLVVRAWHYAFIYTFGRFLVEHG